MQWLRHCLWQPKSSRRSQARDSTLPNSSNVLTVPLSKPLSKHDGSLDDTRTMEVVRAVPDSAVQETSFEEDASLVADITNASDDEPANKPQPHLSYGSASRGRSPGQQQQDGPPDSITPSKLTSQAKSPDRALAPDLLRGLLVLLMALDYNLIVSRWGRDKAGQSGKNMAAWDKQPLAYVIIRLFTHLWPPGLLFLLGMGIVYFGQSRRAVGWRAGAIARHLVSRALVLAVVSVLLGILLTLGHVWFTSLVLFALAVDYLLVGLLWIAVSKTEESLAYSLLQLLPDSKHDDAREPLLADRSDQDLQEHVAPDRKIMRAADMSWHIHNGFLFALGVVSLWWNIWRSQHSHGHDPDCRATDAVSHGSGSSNWLRIWLDVFNTKHVASAYPPLAWLSFAVLGLLYGRVTIARTWTRVALILGNTVIGLVLLSVFVLTRVLQFGNLEPQGCRPQHAAAAEGASRNPSLVSWRAFFSVSRYPPDLAFGSATLGVNFLLLAVFALLPHIVTMHVFQPLQVFGTSVFFFYVVHLILLFSSWLIWSAVYGLPVSAGPWSGQGWGAMPYEWVFWVNFAVLLLVMYPLCRWYGSFKRTRGPDSIWRFF
ncbi:hypothetical protein BD289DRAFT_436438 [Coniella lustricola]|uniref:Heparan-alpha-glucosaminide N-acetyltransferase catalytic domain-containing protein n=1 Tax=Coniella lustricola TaxID=2025994 RepID=A0A2T3A543_9PEZI|nr:hypothetical protein BD289DRAFT_436438 [Coniella lustricola]